MRKIKELDSYPETSTNLMVKEITSYNRANRDLISGVEDQAFGVCILPDELEAIIKNKGRVFVGYKAGKAVAYMVLLHDNIDEKWFQKKAVRALEQDERFMHDQTDHAFVAGEQLYFHLIGVIPEQQGGTGKEMIQAVLDKLTPAEIDMEWVAIIRMNNLASQKTAMKNLGMSMVSIKPKDERKFFAKPLAYDVEIQGSQETNLKASNKIKPITNFADTKDAALWEYSTEKPDKDALFIPAEQGEEVDLSNDLKRMLHEIMSIGGEIEIGKYIIRGIFKGSDCFPDVPELENQQYLYLERIV